MKKGTDTLKLQKPYFCMYSTNDIATRYCDSCQGGLCGVCGFGFETMNNTYYYCNECYEQIQDLEETDRWNRELRYI